jgi:hypothetical protein
VTKTLQTLTLMFAFALASTAMTHAQEKPAAPAAPKAPATVTPIKVQVVVSRYQGEKKVSSMPYNLSINAPADGSAPLGRANLRMGAQVPVMMMAAPVVDGKAMPAAGPMQYKDVGTNIDCFASMLPDGRFKLDITVDDASIYADEPSVSPATRGTPSFRMFKASDSMMLRDGQTAQFTTATDKVNGETVKVDVTLTVVK